MPSMLPLRPTYVPLSRSADIHIGVVLLAKGDRDAALIEMERVNAVDGRQLGLAPI
jgi:hypothetical protein